jgi:hypothetical protein
MWMRYQRILLGSALFLLSGVANAQGLRMGVQQVWSGLSASRPNPYYANIENLGPETNGIISTDQSGNQTKIEYPVELPSGSHKRVLFNSSSFEDSKVLLRTTVGNKEVDIRGNYSNEQARIGLISDNPSDLIFMKGQPQEKNDGSRNSDYLGIGGCTPDDAPDRSFGYTCLDALVLGDGTEKLRDEQIRAIRLYVQSGGSLVFIGGASQSASGDPRWKNLLPVTKTSVVTKSGLTELTGTPRIGSHEVKVQRGSCFLRSYGGGLVSILSVNPFESPIRESEDRRAIMSKSIRTLRSQTFNRLMLGQIGQTNYQDVYGSGTYTTYSPATVVGTKAKPIMPFSQSNLDPYDIKPPSLSSIFWLLLAYGIVVVPINFLILKKLNRMEIAWISTPVISVVFSLILLNSTIGLYKAGQTTRSTAVALLGEPNEDSIVFGRSEMFFPQAKSYNLGVENIEFLLARERYGNSDNSGLNLIDDGRHVIAPNVRTSNLAFKEITYLQTSKEFTGLTVSLIRKDNEPFVRVENRSNLTVNGISIFGPGKQFDSQKALNKGEHLDIEATTLINSKPDKKRDLSVTGWSEIANTTPNRIVVLMGIESVHVGPKYGEGHPASRYMAAAVPQWSESL